MRKATNIDKPTAAWRVMATMDDGDGTRLCAISRNYAARDAADAFAELARKGGVADAYVQAVPEREPRKLRNIGRIDAA